MELKLSPADAAFQSEVRGFIRAALPGDIKAKVELGQHLEKDDYVRWHKILFAKGWVAPAWPVEYGGAKWTPLQRHLFEEELAIAATPRLMPFGLAMVAPVIMAFGDAAQIKHFLPRILSCEDWWCQGYSEPGAGSDLASLTTKAVAEGDDYIVSGTKTWTTLAQYADMIFCLVRTSSEGKPQQGITFLMIDMHSPGITVRPIRTLDGGYEINDVFFDEVRVPQTNRVGEENKGWTYAKYLLQHERSGTAGVANSKAQINRLKKIAARERAGGRFLIDDPDFRRQIAEVEIELQALEYTDLRYVMTAASGQPVGAETSMLKLRGTEIQQRISELLMQAMGPYALPYLPEAMEYGWNEDPVGPAVAPPLAPAYFNKRKTSIYGGSNEIQRDILAKMVLGL